VKYNFKNKNKYKGKMKAVAISYLGLIVIIAYIIYKI